MADQKGTDQKDTAQAGERSGIDWAATFAGAGAAVTVAVLLSTLGAAGTLIGAALGSVVATVSTALYKQGIETSRKRVAEVQAAALQKVALADLEVRRARRSAGPAAGAGLDRAHAHLDEASSALEPGAEGGEESGDEESGDEEDGAGDGADATTAVGTTPAAPGTEGSASSGNRWRDLPWRRLAVFTAVVFVIALLVISLVELLAGRSVSTITGGTDGDRTSITGIFGDRTGSDDDPAPSTPTEDATTPTAPTTTAPTEQSSATVSQSTEVPTESPSATVTETVTVGPSPTETPAPSDAATP